MIEFYKNIPADQLLQCAVLITLFVILNACLLIGSIYSYKKDKVKNHIYFSLVVSILSVIIIVASIGWLISPIDEVIKKQENQIVELEKQLKEKNKELNETTKYWKSLYEQQNQIIQNLRDSNEKEKLEEAQRWLDEYSKIKASYEDKYNSLYNEYEEYKENVSSNSYGTHGYYRVRIGSDTYTIKF